MPTQFSVFVNSTPAPGIGIIGLSLQGSEGLAQKS